MGPLVLKVLDLSSQRPERGKQIHRFSDSTVVVFFVDISQYDELTHGQPDENRIMESLRLFDSVLNDSVLDSRRPFSTSIILLLGNIKQFEEKLISKPLSNYFPDYSGENDFSSVSSYFFERFYKVNPKKLALFASNSELEGDNMDLVWLVARKTVLDNKLRDSGLI